MDEPTEEVPIELLDSAVEALLENLADQGNGDLTLTIDLLPDGHGYSLVLWSKAANAAVARTANYSFIDALSDLEQIFTTKLAKFRKQ